MSLLNPEQQKAVLHVNGPLLVLAGAGSGKTRVVTARISHLIDLGISSSEILALTFTNKAAEEMKQRIRAQKNVNVLATTFHSLGAKILRESISSLGFRPDFAIYDASDSEKLLKLCLEELGFGQDKSVIKKMKTFISNAKNGLLEAEEIDDPEERGLFELYEKKLKECNALDFDDLLYLTVKLLQKDPQALQEYQNRWLYLLIDEYQDTNMAQYILAKTLSAKHGNLFAVGDPDQSIYSWRGAKYQNILRFESDFPGAKVITLNQNYRSTDIILQAANALIRNNQKRYDKKLWSSLGEGHPILLFVGNKEKDEAQFVAQEILRQKEQAKISYDEMVVFYRTNAQSRLFEDLFLSYKIPYEIIGGVSFYDRKEIKDLLSYLKMIISDSDLISFLRTINQPKRGLGEAFVDKLVAEATEKKIAIFSFCQKALQEEILITKLTARQRKGLQSYVDLILSLRREKDRLGIYQLIQKIVTQSGYLTFLEEDPETSQDRKENIDALITKACEWEDLQEKPTLSQFLEELSLRSQVDEITQKASVKLMTLHNGKGLEFAIVFLVGLEEDLLPHINSKNEPEKVEEERRLCYVGMTRAKKQLYLTRVNYRSVWGTFRTMYPSRFWREIPKELTKIRTCS